MSAGGAMAVREARADDLAAVIGLLREDAIREIDETAVPVAAYADAFAEILADAHQQLLVGEVDGELVATAQLSWLRRLSYVGGLMCVVESVRVRSDRRGAGLGRALMLHVETLAVRRGAARVELTTNAARPRARSFYEGLGYRASHVGMKRYLGGVR
ncbi:MAG: GNAT family N-acetyltransferase [Nocardioides sp.]